MRILLISANREPFPEPVFPLGAVYVGNALMRAGARVRIFDMRHHLFFTSLKREIIDFRPDYIAISLRNIDNVAYPASRFYLPAYASLAEKVKAICKAPIILGGSAFSLFPEEIAQQMGADRGVIGEGEKLFWMLPREGSRKIMKSEVIAAEDISFPRNIEELFPRFRRYRTIGIQTARGCPNHCIYCTYPQLEGATRRARAPEHVVDEICMLNRDFGIRNFFIVDSLLNADIGHMVRILEKLIERRLSIRFSCYLQPHTPDPVIFRLLKKAGCVAVDFGTDSGSDTVLASLKKPFSKNDIRKASRACKEAGVDFCHSLIFGGPGETSETIEETVRLMEEISPRAVVAMTGIRIYPGTELARIALKEGVLDPGASLLAPRFYFSPMGSSALLKSVYGAAQGRRNWFFPGEKNWGSSLGFKMLHFLYRRGPLWRTFGKGP